VSTDRVSSSSSLLDLARALGISRKKRAGAAKTRSGSAQPAARAHDSTILRKQLIDLLYGIDPNDDAAVETIRRPVLQEILLWEFGSDFRQHPEFAPMLDRLEQTLIADPRAQARLSRLIRQLHRCP